MSLFDMLKNAVIVDANGDEIGEVDGFSVFGDKLTIVLDTAETVEEDGDDPDDGEEVDVEDEGEQWTNEGPVPLSLVGGGYDG